MQEQEKIRQLFERYRRGQCTPEEQARLHAWFNRYAANEAQGLDNLGELYVQERTALKKRWSRRLQYAAALLITVVAAWYVWEDRAVDEPSTNLVVEKDIPPGGNKATLTLADGRTIDLSEAQSGIVVGDGIAYLDGSEVFETGDGKLEAEDSLHTGRTIDDLRLTTPKGGTYQITLSDGTKVWLNAASTLKYPSRFDGAERVVEVEGEAYFSVAKDKRRPFKVISGSQQIEVLGTEFNVSAYADEKDVKTTLVEGSIELQVNSSGKRMALVPGEQSVLKGGEVNKRKVDVGPYIAWKDGNFNFDNTALADMMKQMSRWYGVDVVYENGVPNERFSGAMSRNVSLQTVLELLRVSEINYRIESNTLIID